MKKFLEEFKAFAMRGNVMDLAVGVIVGGAFGSITSSLIDDIIMPVVGIFVSQASFADLSVQIGGAVMNFLIMAFVVFCMVKAINKLHHNTPQTPPPPPAPSKEEQLLTEIRDLLKEKG